MITVKKYDETLRSDLEIFLSELKEYGFDNFNWSSVERMKTDKITYYLAYYKNKIVATNGCYKWRDNDWILFTRIITHPKYFKLLGKTKNVWSMSIPVRFLAWPTLMHCLDNGAKNLFYTVNLPEDGNDENKSWVDGVWPMRHSNLLERLGLAEYYGMEKINGLVQDVYKMNTDEYIRQLKIVLEQPLKIYEIE